MSLSSEIEWPTDLSPEDAFEQAWQRYYQQGGEVPRLADYLPAVDDPDYVQLTVHLIEIDLERRWCANRFQKQARGLADTSTGANEHPTDRPVIKPRAVAEYLQSLNWQGDLEVLPDLLAAEYEAQRRAGQVVAANEYLERYAELREVLQERFAGIEEEIRQEQQGAVQRSSEPLPEIPGFVIERELGRGGMSIVYLAYDLSLHRQVAIKHLKHAPQSAAELARLELEPAVQAQFRLPNVVRIHGKGTCAGRPYLVCEYVNGQSLRAAIKTTTLPPQRAAELVAHIARTMHAVHDAGILHRDLKPENILLDQAGTPLVADFGIAKVTPDHAWVREAAAQGQIELTMQGEIMGTPGYMAPEQAAGDIGHGRTIDVYGLGGILYAVLTGRPPFFGSTRDETMHSVRHDEPVEPRRLNPRVPRDLNTICLKCLAKKPQKRYETAEELAEDLERFVKGEPIRARAVGYLERGYRWCLRNQAVASLLAAIVLLLVAGTTVSSLLANSAIRARQRVDTQFHTAQVRRAYEMIHKGNIGGALRLLHTIGPRVAGTAPPTFDWNFALRLCHSERLALVGHTAKIQAVAVARDGKTLASASADGELRIVDVVTGKLLNSAKIGLPIDHMKFNHDGSRLAVATGDGAIGIWQIAREDCRELIAYQAHLMPVIGLAFHPSDNTIASVSAESGLHVWNAESGQRALQQGAEITSFVKKVTFAADGKSVWVYADRTYTDGDGELWKLDLGTEQFEPLTLELTVPALEDPATIEDAEFSSDGSWLYIVGSDNRARGFQFGELGLELKWTLPPNINEPKLLVTDHWLGLFEFSSKQLNIVDPRYGRQLRALRGHAQPVLNAVASQDGSVIAVVSADRVIKVWNGNEEADGLTLRGHEATVKVLAISPDGRTLASGGNDYGVYLWDLESGAKLHRLGKHKVVTKPRADGGPGPLRSVGTYFGHQLFVSGLAFSPDGQSIISLGEDQRLMVWDVATGKLDHEIATKVPATRGLAGHPSRDEVAYYDMHGKVHFCDWRRGAITGELQIKDVKFEAVAYSPDGTLLATGGSDGSVRLWRDSTREPIATLQGLPSDVERLAFNRSGTLLAAGDSGGAIRVWGLPQLQLKYVIEGTGDRVSGLNFTTDDRLMVTAGRSGRSALDIWDLATNQELFSLPGDFAHCLMTADGTRIVTFQREHEVLRVLDSRPIDNQPYRREPALLTGAPEIESPPLGSPPPLRAVGYFSSDSIPFIDGEFHRVGVKWISPKNRDNHFVGIRLVMPSELTRPTAEEFEKYYRRWDKDGSTPIDRADAGISIPAQFKLLAAGNTEFVGKLHGSWPFTSAEAGFVAGSGTSRHFGNRKPLDRSIYVVVFETPKDTDLSALRLQMRTDEPVTIPNERLLAPERPKKPMRSEGAEKS